MNAGRTIRVHVEFPDQPWLNWVASSWCTMPSVTRHIQRMNEYAKNRGHKVTYRLATEEEYQAYRQKVKSTVIQCNSDPEKPQLDF